MLIAAVESSVASIPFTMGGPCTAFAGQRWDRLETLLVRVKNLDGLTGWGEAFRARIAAPTGPDLGCDPGSGKLARTTVMPPILTTA